MKLQARQKLATGELGRLFWLTGTAEEPRIGTIYDKEKDATDFSLSEIESIVYKYGHVLEFYPG